MRVALYLRRYLSTWQLSILDFTTTPNSIGGELIYVRGVYIDVYIFFLLLTWSCARHIQVCHGRQNTQLAYVGLPVAC